MIDDLQPRRDAREKTKAGQAILDSLGSGMSVEQLAELTESAPAEIGQALVEAAERAKVYRSLDLIKQARQEEAGIRPGECWNGACKDHVPAAMLRKRDHVGEYEIGDPTSWHRCGRGDDKAVSCIFRMIEQPSSDPFSDIPSHAEAIRMLQRAGLLKPDEFGKWNGTDFAFRGAVAKLWWAHVKLLVETGKIPAAMFTCDDGEQVPDMGARVDAALDHVGLERRQR
jgi:hypothetical protein